MEMTLNFQSVARCTVVRVFCYWAVETIVMGSVCRRMATEVVRCHTTQGKVEGAADVTLHCKENNEDLQIFYVNFFRNLSNDIDNLCSSP